MTRSFGSFRALFLAAAIAALAVLLALVVAMFDAEPATATEEGPSVMPVVVAGNPNCVSLGYDYGYKPQPEPPPSGTYTFPGDTNTVTITSDGIYFDWVSTLGIDAVIVKGGPNANAYVYDPPEESFGDSGLSAPINNTTPYGISHIEFCYDYELDVSKVANTTLTRTFGWTIVKTVDRETLDMFTGDSGKVEYTVTVTKDDGTDSDWEVNGTITIENNTRSLPPSRACRT